MELIITATDIMTLKMIMLLCRLDIMSVTSFHITGGTTCSTRQQTTLRSPMLRFDLCLSCSSAIKVFFGC